MSAADTVVAQFSLLATPTIANALHDVRFEGALVRFARSYASGDEAAAAEPRKALPGRPAMARSRSI